MPDDELLTDLQWPQDPLREPRTERLSEQSGDDRHESDPNPPWSEPVAVVRPHPGHLAELEGVGGDRTTRFVVEAYDRLADRLLERLRALREDVDADLAGVRSELSSLRQAVDDVGDRVQLRQLRASIDELRGDVSGLRRAVIEWPELEQVSSDVAGLRADFSNLLERNTDAAADEPGGLDLIRAELHEIRRLLDSSRGLSVFAPLIEEVAGLREEVTALRHRIALRASGGAVELNEEQLQRMIVAIEARVLGREGPGRRTRAE